MWSRLVEPSTTRAEVAGPTARLLAALLPAHLLAIVVGAGLVEVAWVLTRRGSLMWGATGAALLAVTTLIAASWRVLRTGNWPAAATLYLTANLAFPLSVPFLGPGRLWMLASAIIPIMLAALALPGRWVFGVMLVVLGGGAAELVFLPLQPDEVSLGLDLLITVFAAGLLTLVLRHHYRTLEELRLRDVSERRAAEQTLRHSETRYRTLFSTVTDGIFLTSQDGRLIEVNDAACRRLGYTRQELLSMRMDEIVDVLRTGPIPGTLTKTGHAVFERTHRCKDGSTYPAEVLASLTEVDGAPAVMEVARELTERRRAEAEQQRLQEQLQQAAKMESIGRLAGGVAHDFNNLLTAVLGNVGLAELRAQAGESVAEPLAHIREAATSAAALTRQLLAFSRKQALEPRLLDLNELLGRMHGMLTRVIGETVELRVVRGTGLCAVRADPGLLEQAILNLAVNARDAMAEGGVLTVQTARVDLDAEYARSRPLVVPGPHVVLSVSDNGSGISDEMKSHLFEPFFTTKSRERGTGLGLATTYSAVRQSNGTIEVDSEPGKGTTFRIFLPAVSEKAEHVAAAPAAPEPIASASPAGGPETVLVVEDDPRVRGLTARALTACGYEVLVAGNGEDALALATQRTAPIHLLLTDVVMPGINGRQLAERLARVHAETRVLYTSGYTGSIIAHYGVLDSGIEFLAKPFTIEGLARRVRQLLDGR